MLHENPQGHPMITLKGIAINGGKILAPVCLYSAQKHRKVTLALLNTDEEEHAELKRYDHGLKVCAQALNLIAADVTKNIGKAEAEIFITQRHIMTDPEIVGRIKHAISHDRKNVEFAVNEVFATYEAQFAKLDNEYLRERASDIDEVRRRLLDHLHDSKPGLLCEGQSHCRKGADRIIASEQLMPDMIVHMQLEKVQGFVTEHGGMSSHAAIIARSLGIPAVSGLHGLMEHATCGTMVLIDGDNGIAYVNPTPETIAQTMPVAPVAGETLCIIKTPDGMEVMANASLLEDVKAARAIHADGIGLLRTEILFLRENRLLNEDEQFKFYQGIAETMEGRPVTFRMLDVGGDKPLPFFRIKKEENPYLGWRGARFLLGSMDIFSAQMRALARVSRLMPIRIMFPMVVDAVQYAQLLSAARSFIQEVDSNPENIRLGAMFEVPSACMCAEEIFKNADFGSIGSNDLIQYLFAVDRNNELVSGDYNPDHPVLWNTLRLLSDAAHKHKKPLSVCGEMAGREGMAAKLLDIGITTLSVSPRLIPRVRNEMAGWVGSNRKELGPLM